MVRNSVIYAMAAVIILCVTFGCGRAKEPDHHAFDDAAYRVNEFTSRFEGEITQHFGNPDREVLGSLRNGLSVEARMPLALAKLQEDTLIKEWWYFRHDAFCVIWLSRNDKGEWVSVADFAQGPGLDYFLWLREAPEGPAYHDRQYLGWTEEAVVEKFGHPQRRGAKYNESGLFHVSLDLEKNAQEATKRTNPETKEYYYNRTNENVQTIFQFAKDPEKGWVVIYDFTLNNDWIL